MGIPGHVQLCGISADFTKTFASRNRVRFFDGKALVSIVGFLFNDTKVLGIHLPFHVNFEEAILRYYVKQFDSTHWKRGVGFVSEIVPKPLVASMANLLYNEHFSTAKMGHRIIEKPDNLLVEYSWKKRNQIRNVLQINTVPELQDIEAGSEAEFICEHYFGYNQLNSTTTIEYALNHPRWKVYPVTGFSLDCEIENLYGKEFVPYILNKQPHSVFLAKGTSVTVKMPLKINGVKNHVGF